MSTLVVTNLNDDNSAGSLRSQIAASQSGDTITFNSSLLGGTLVLAQGELAVTHALTIEGDIDGDGKADITVDGNHASRVFSIDDGSGATISATLDGLIVTGGAGGFHVSGGGVAVGVSDRLTISNSVVTGNQSGFYGGGIYGANGSAITAIATTISDNTTSVAGGGIALFSGASLTLVGSTVSGNYARGDGGGIFGTTGSGISLTNTTVSGNGVGHEGGGIYADTNNPITLNNSTVTGNYAGFAAGGIWDFGGGVHLSNSIVAANLAAALSATNDLDGSGTADLVFSGGNIVGSTPARFSSVTGTATTIDERSRADLQTVFTSVGSDPHTGILSGVLADNGGPVFTVAINPTGGAHDTGSEGALTADTFDLNHNGNTTEPVPVDARGGDRVSGAHTDIGAFESQATPATLVVTTLSDNTYDGGDLLAETADGGGLSLREALALASQDPGTAHTITFDPSLTGGHTPSDNGHLVLTNGELVVSSDVLIEGDTNGDNRTDIQIDGGGASRVFHVTAGTSTFHAVTVTGGGGSAGYGGGFAIDAGATVTIADSIVANNHVASYGGGGIANDGTLNLTNSFLAANTAAYSGGGLYNHGTASLTNTTLYANSAYNGGGIFNAAGSDLHVVQSTLTGNYAGLSGGGIYAAGSAGSPGHFVLTNSIVAGNAAADGTTGDLYVATGADNTHAGVNLFLQAGAGAAQDITATDLHDVFAGVTTSIFTSVESGQAGDNGGPVPTVGIKTGGLAHDAGDDSAVPVDLLTDARDLAREAGAHVDIGAVELQAGQSFVVTTLTDELDSSNPHATLADFGGAGDLSLREALVLAQQDPLSADTITFAASLVGGSNPGVDDGHLTLTNGSLIVAGNVTIDGDVNSDHTPDITLDGDGSSNVLAIAGGTSTLNGLTITNGNSLYGGGLIVGSYNGSGATADVTLSNSSVHGNSALYGGGIAVGYGALHLVNTVVSGNHAGIGGGIAVNGGGTLTALNTTISGNDATLGYGYGGGLANAGSSTLINSTVSGNTAIAGGGIYTSSDLTLINTTVANNQATYGGGVYTTPCGCATATLTNSTVTGNYAHSGGGIYHSAGTLNLTNTIVAGNGAGYGGPDLFALGTVNYAGVNIFSQSHIGQPGIDIYEPNLGNIFITLVTVDPDGTPGSGDEFVAGALANNGGAVQTVAINPTGTARDAGSDAAAVYDDDANPATPDVAIPTDARGLTRTVGAHVDIGAVEAQLAAPTDIALSPASVPENSANGTVVGHLSDTDTDPGDSATYTLLDDAGGRFAISGSDLVVADGTKLDFETNTSHQVTVRVTDGAGLTFDKVLSIGVTNVNEAPVAANGAASGNEDTAITGALAATDVDSASLTYSRVADAAHGSVTVHADGTFSYTPNADFNGNDSFTYKANDGALDSNVATVTLAVGAVNDAPSFTKGADQVSNEDAGAQAIAGWASVISAGPADEAGQAVGFVVSNNSNPGLFAAAPSIAADGTLTYTAAANANGTATITVHAHDNGGTANGGVDSSADQTFTITVNPVNDAPVAVNGTASGNEDTVITGTLSASDIDSASLAYSRVANAAHGSVTVHADGTFSYTPNPDFNGTDSFSFKANDGTLDSNVAAVSLTVNPVNDAPVAANGAASGNEDTVITGTLSASDVDSASLTYSRVANAAHGSVTVHTDGTFSYTPNADFNGTDSFSFKANDGTLDSNVATVSLTVDPVNDAPVAANGAASGSEDSIITGTLSANDIDSASLTYSAVSQPAHGSLTVHTDGAFSYTPNPDFNGTDSFSFKANDGTLDSNAATESLTVNPVDDAPVAANGAASGNEDAVIAGTVSATDIDSSPAQLTFALVGVNGGAAHGSVVFNPNGTFVYTPAHDFNGSDSFSFKANDGTLDSNAATESLTVSAVNDAPVNTVPGALSVESGLDALIMGLAVHDVDAVSLTTSLHVDHGTLAVGSAGGAAVTGSGTATVTLIGSVAQIDATLGAASNVIYHSALGFAGTDHLTVTSNDGGSSGAGGPLSDTDIVDINVGAFSFAPPHLAYSDFHLG